MAILILGTSTVGTASAATPMTPEEQNIIDGDRAWHTLEKPSQTCSTQTGDIPTGNAAQNAQSIFTYFVQVRGLKPWMAAGFLGNMQSESGLNPRALEPGTTGDAPISGRGYGLVQWTYPDRQDPLIERGNAPGKHVYDMDVQLDYVWWEITEGQFKHVLDQLVKTTDVVAATRLIEDRYEIHAGGPQPARVRQARAWLDKLGSSTDPASMGTVNNTCGAEGSGTIVGDMSLPVDQKWYDQHPIWFTKDHHDYPSADIPVPKGTKVYAVAGGKITKAPIKDINCSGCASGSYGRGVEIDSGNGITMIYAHGSDGGDIPGAAKGDTVKAGQMIMHSASTGNSTGPHLHYEIQVNGDRVCPQNLLKALGEGSKTLPNIAELPKSGCTN